MQARKSIVLASLADASSSRFLLTLGFVHNARFCLFGYSLGARLTYAERVEDRGQRKKLVRYSHLFNMTGFMSDVCIYVFGNKNVRKILCSVFRKGNLDISNRVRYI